MILVIDMSVIGRILLKHLGTVDTEVEAERDTIMVERENQVIGDDPTDDWMIEGTIHTITTIVLIIGNVVVNMMTTITVMKGARATDTTPTTEKWTTLNVI